MNKEIASNPGPKSPIKSGWRGHLNGHLENTDGAHIEVSEITLRLDGITAYALANLLGDESIKRSGSCEGSQIAALSTLGAALGRLIDHWAANNGGRKEIK